MAILIQNKDGRHTTKTTLAIVSTTNDCAGKKIVVTGNETVTNLTWPADRGLAIEPGGKITVTGTLHIIGPFEAGNYEVFDGPGTVTFDASSVMFTRSIWGCGVTDNFPAKVLAEIPSPPAPLAVLPNTGSADKRNLVLLGDSISHGAFSVNTFMHGWARILERFFNADVGATSYGFVNLIGMPDALSVYTLDIHAVYFTGDTWTAVDSATSSVAANYPPGMAMRAGGNTSVITIEVPVFQNQISIYYGKQPGGGIFTVTVNGVLAATIDTDAVAADYDIGTYAMSDRGDGYCIIVIASTSAASDPVDIIGVSYLSSYLEPVFHNYSTSGRRLAHISQQLIDKLCLEAGTLVVALGHNDFFDADSDDTYYADFMQRIGWLTTAAIAGRIRVVVPDFCWSAGTESRARAALLKLATDTGGTYVNLPDVLFPEGVVVDTDYLINTLEMWTDGSHPNIAGHQWVAESVGKAMHFSCTSKQAAIQYHDWWMPVALKAATGVVNYFPTIAANLSRFRRNGSILIVTLFVKKTSAGAGSFPVGEYLLQDAWPDKSELTLQQGYTGIGVIRSDTGAVVSTLSASQGGSLTLKVLSGTWLSDQQITFHMPLL